MIDNYLHIESIDPQYWGRSGWIFLNSIALTYKPEYKEKYKTFFEQLPFILPCKTCGSNLVNNMSGLDEALESKQKLLNWLLNTRNEIYEENMRHNEKKTLKNNLDEIFYKRCENSLYLYLTMLFLLFVLLIIVFKYVKTDSDEK